MAVGVTSQAMRALGMTAIRYVFIRSSALSAQSDRLPPEEADRQPDCEMQQRDEKPDAPPLRLRQVASPEYDRRGAGAVAGRSRLQTREDSENHAPQHPRSAAPNPRPAKARKPCGSQPPQAVEPKV